ncbi:DUF2460 domain-containing protein [bacterium]|nr:DUF2460 domain-containing protein [bacterium]
MAVLNVIPDFVFEEKIEFETLITKFENGVEQRRSKQSIPLRKWTLQFHNRTTEELTTIRSFYVARKGSYESFTWVNPNDSVEYAVRFDSDSFVFVNKASGIYDCSFSLTEVK